jgi:rod shape-determining protein MreB
MFNFIFSLFSNDMGIDLGTATVLVHVKDQGIVLNEPSVVALEKETKNVVAVGVEAKEMLGKTPSDIIAVRPLRNGVIADFAVAEKMIRYFIKKVHNRSSLLHPRIVVGVPSGITEVERRAVREAAVQAGARKVYLIDEPFAAAMGANLPIQEAQGSMIVDIGGGTTEVAVLSLGGMVTAKSLGVAGDEMDESIAQFFRRKYNLLIGENTAEEVKVKIGSVFVLQEELSLEVKGRDQLTGLPKTITISSEEARQALLEPTKLIVELIKSALEDTPAALSADLVDKGIVLAGGGSLLRGLPELLSEETKLPVKITENPITSVVRGTGRYLEGLDDLKQVRKRSLV